MLKTTAGQEGQNKRKLRDNYIQSSFIFSCLSPNEIKTSFFSVVSKTPIGQEKLVKRSCIKPPGTRPLASILFQWILK